uniref:Peptidase S1 domain-containing protein n=1 Tax=Cyanoderma ruficeps TaxID=181631 RepID=A0A8C3QIF4_9PASS
MALVSFRISTLPAPAWLVFAGIVTHGSLQPQAGVPVREIILHPLYSHSSLDYDIALMRLQVPLNFSAVCLPPSRRDLLQGTPCWVSGWGYTLREAEVKLIDYKICNSDKVYEGYLTPRMMCAGYLQGGKDACQVSWGRTRGQLTHSGYPQRVSCVPSSLLCPSEPG